MAMLSIGGDAAVGGPGSKALHGFVHDNGEWAGLLDRVENMFGGEFFAFCEGAVHAGEDGLFDFGAGEPVGGLSEQVEVKLVFVSPATAEMDGEYCLALPFSGQVDEEDFVEASFAHQFGREVGDVVGGGDHEDWVAMILHPGQERAEHALGESAVGGVGSG